MKRYIDADKTKKELLENAVRIYDPKNMSTEDAMHIIDEQPTADVVEVKHGYWKDRYGNKYANHLYECSVCGGRALYEFYMNELYQEKSRQALTPGCPHCLAVMDGKDNNVPANGRSESMLFPKLQMNDFIEVANNKEMRFFLNDKFEQFDGIVHPDEDYEFKEEDITEVWRQADSDTFKCIYRRR